MMLHTDLILCGLLSIIIGVISAVLGLGGGFLLIPMYTLLFGLDPVLAIGTSLTTTIFTAGSASVCHAREKNIQYPVVFLLILGSLPTIIVAIYLTQFIPGFILSALFSLLLVYIAISMVIDRGSITCSTSEEIPPTFSPVEGYNWRNVLKHPILFIWGIAGGLVSGLSGVSAGTIYVPALLRSGFPIKYAVAASLASIVIISSGAALMSLLLGQIAFSFLIFSAGGVSIGAIIGVRLSNCVRSSTIRYMFSLAMIGIAVVMLNNEFSQLMSEYFD